MLQRALHWLRANGSLALAACALASVASSAFNVLFAVFSLAYLALCAIAHLINTIRKTNAAPLIPSPAHGAMLVLLFMAGLSLLITATPDLTHVQVARLFIGMGAGWGVRNWLQQHLPASDGLISALSLSLSALGLGFAVLAPFGVDWFSGKLPIPLGIYAAFPRLLSDGIHPNVMAGLLVLFLPIALAALTSGARAMRLVHGLAAWVMLVMLVLTQSRGGLLAFAISLAVLIGLVWAKARPFLIVLGGVCLALALISAFAPAVLPSALQQFIQRLLLVSSSATAELRYEAWQRAWYMVQDFPLTGIGMGGYKIISDVMYPTFVSAEALPHAHNLFLQVAVDVGVPGLLAWLTLIGTALYVGLHAIRHSEKNNPQRALAIGLFTSQIALLVHGLVDAVVWGQVRIAPVVWLLVGMALGLHRVRYTR